MTDHHRRMLMKTVGYAAVVIILLAIGYQVYDIVPYYRRDPTVLLVVFGLAIAVGLVLFAFYQLSLSFRTVVYFCALGVWSLLFLLLAMAYSYVILRLIVDQRSFPASGVPASPDAQRMMLQLAGLSLFFFSISVVGWVKLFRKVRHHLQARQARTEQFRICPACSYSLRGLPDAGRCPECGSPYSLTDLEKTWTQRLHVVSDLGKTG